MAGIEFVGAPGALSGAGMLNAATRLATFAHDGQWRQDQETGERKEPYVFHPIRVASRVDGFDLKTVALLHDIVEDTEWTLEELLAYGFPKHIVEAIGAITRDKGQETYAEFVARLSSNELARTVKLADIEDNSTDLTWERDASRLQRYAKAKCVLNQVATVTA